MKKYLEKVCKLNENTLAGLGVSRLSLYKMVAEYDRTIYAHLNKLIAKGALFQGYFWSLKTRSEIYNKLDLSGHQVHELEIEEIYHHGIPPPTYFRTNTFLEPFQEIVNTYGVPVYKEANPAVFTIISFPFLFGVMFGDLGHGGILFLVGIFLCLFNKRLEDTSIKQMVDVRYLILLLGFFSTFCGLIYNDFMSLPVEIWDSCYIETGGEYLHHKKNCVYPFGVDSSWYLGRNELTYLNSLKMKLSVIFGVTQMTLGIILKATNARFFNRKLDFYFEFIPQIVLLWAIFGYMITLIIVKWLTDYSKNTSIAPSIISYMIDMFLNFGDVTGDALIINQGLNETLHLFLLFIALV